MTRKNSDNICPAHYRIGKMETIEEMALVFGQERTIDFCLMNAWKYRARAHYKGNEEEDLAKANRYLEMAKELNERFIN